MVFFFKSFSFYIGRLLWILRTFFSYSYCPFLYKPNAFEDIFYCLYCHLLCDLLHLRIIFRLLYDNFFFFFCETIILILSCDRNLLN